MRVWKLFSDASPLSSPQLPPLPLLSAITALGAITAHNKTPRLLAEGEVGERGNQQGGNKMAFG